MLEVEDKQQTEKSIVLTIRQLLKQQAQGTISKEELDAELEHIWNQYYRHTKDENRFLALLRSIARELFPSLTSVRR